MTEPPPALEPLTMQVFTLMCSCAVNVIPDKPNYTTPKVVKPGSSDVLEATHFLASLGGPKHAHQVSLCHDGHGLLLLYMESFTLCADAKPSLCASNHIKSGVWLEA